MNYDQMIAVLQAAKDGKAIQMRAKVNRLGGAWWDVADPFWDFSACDYRVKPEPRVFYAILGEDTYKFIDKCVVYLNREQAEKFAGRHPDACKVVKLVEAPDDSM